MRSNSFIHHHVFIRNDELAETKLPANHTREERIAELKTFGENNSSLVGMGFYIGYKINQFEGFTDEFYQTWLKQRETISKWRTEEKK
jgi:hypothetical protein